MPKLPSEVFDRNSWKKVYKYQSVHFMINYFFCLKLSSWPIINLKLRILMKKQEWPIDKLLLGKKIKMKKNPSTAYLHLKRPI